MPSKPTPKNTTLTEEIAFRYLPFWPLFIILAFCFSGLALVYLRYATPIYEANATLLIKDEKKGSEEINVSEALNVLSSKKIVENEIVVLQSRNLADEVVRSLHLYAPIYENSAVGQRSAYTSSPVIVTAPDLNQIKEVKSPVSFRYDAAAGQVLLDGKGYPLHQPVSTPYGTLRFSLNPRLKTPADGELSFRLLEPRAVAAGLVKQVEVMPAGKLSSIVRLRLKDEVPQRGEDILNTLIRKYNDASIDYKKSIARNTIAFVDERMQIVQRELSTVEKQIQSYKAQKGIVDLSEQGRLYLKQVGENDQKLADIRMRQAVLDQVERYITSHDTKSSIAPSTLGVKDPLLSGLLDKLYETELERERLSKTTAENHPVMQAINDQIARLRPGILENVRNQRSSLIASERDLSSTNSGYANMLQGIPQKERELLDVSRQQSIKNSIYSFLLQKREETAIASASHIPDSKVVETARASILPVSPGKGLVMAIAVVLALLATMIYVLVKETFSRKLLFRSELENGAAVPVVAEIDYSRSGNNLPPDMVIGEQMRQLRVSAGLFSRQSGKKKILITSSISGEGKSFLSRQLAWNLSLSGKKVVLVDTDLRNPQATLNLTTAKGPGLAEYLEKEIEPYEIIKGTDNPQLFVVSAGQTETHATELLLNGKIAALFEYLEEAFDFIILDAAPVGMATDAYILADYSDKTLFVVRHAHTPKSFIHKLDETNPARALPGLSIVFNGVRPRGIFGQGDSLGFGYGYGDNRVYTKPAKRGVRTLFRQLQSTLRRPH